MNVLKMDLVISGPLTVHSGGETRRQLLCEQTRN